MNPPSPAAVSVRSAHTCDAAAIAAIYGQAVRDTVASFEERPPGVEEVARRMQARPRLPWLVADAGGQVAGYAYASPHRARAAYRWSVDFSVYVDPQFARRGLGRALYGRLTDETRALGYVNAFAGIALPNAASVALHEALGFLAVGVFRDVGFKHGGWRDVGWWRLQLREPPARPPEPKEWDPGD